MSFELGTDGPKVIVAGVDGSETSLRAGAYAWGLARRHGSQLLIVHVAPMSAMSAATPGGAAVMRETGEEIASDLRRQIEEIAGHYDVRYTFMSEQGDPFGVLARVADESKADAVVVGASAQAGHRFVGSVAVRLVKAGRWPVTVVP